jgi:hypothetical protein
MTTMTPESAAETLCPLARTFSLPQAQKGCHGPSCALWRWLPISADDPRFIAARAKALEELGGGGLMHKAAVAKVMANREAYGIPTKPERGFCGGGGQP